MSHWHSEWLTEQKWKDYCTMTSVTDERWIVEARVDGYYPVDTQANGFYTQRGYDFRDDAQAYCDTRNGKARN